MAVISQNNMKKILNKTDTDQNNEAQDLNSIIKLSYASYSS